MADAVCNLKEPWASRLPVEEMRDLFHENRCGQQRGIYSVCSANRLVLEAAFSQALRNRSPLLIEATCNQANQDGGYTGLTPEGFRDYVYGIAIEMRFPVEKLILGGDHLGPNPWKTQPAAAAMKKAGEMVASYAAAGFSKIHLDASMACGGDEQALKPEEIADRAARLCEAAEWATRTSTCKPVYVIGTEVPTPGGAQEDLDIAVTTTANLSHTLDTHREDFMRRGLDAAWQRVIGVVVQPGVEFSDEVIADFLPERASALADFILQREAIVFEAHSTDYQTAAALRHLVSDHFGILKVGPELTFVMREAVFGLACIEKEWVPVERCSRIREIIERVMVETPEHWKAYYRGSEAKLRVARAYSLSDRIRYYWPNNEVSRSLAVLMQNLRESPAPYPLIAQYLPRQAEAIRSREINNDPIAIVHHKIGESLSRYADACGLSSAR
jgi:D-tagatose-1,6-bisphosphate aldolase subunit GatZ/KbaZ